MHIRHHSLYTPCDFDLSPYFQIVKPTLEYGFDYKTVMWDDTAAKPLLLEADPAEARESGGE
jgi:hypothetical protein